MISALAYSILGAGSLLAAWVGFLAYRDRPTADVHMIGAIVLEVGLLVQTVIGLLRLPGAHLTEPVTYVAYQVGVLLVLPVGFQLARIERSRWGSAALAFTALVTALMTLRLLQLWREA